MKYNLVKGPEYVYWLVTNLCNLHCKFCQKKSGVLSDKEVDFPTAAKAINDMARIKTHRLLISGGEPLVREDIIELMELAHRKGLVVELYTNGLLVPKFEKYLRAIPFAQVDVSIDGLPDSHDHYRGAKGGFERAMHALSIFKDMGVPIRRVSTLAYRGNLHELEALRQMVIKSSANAWILNTPTPDGRAKGKKEMALSAQECTWIVNFVKKHGKEFRIELSEAAGYLGQENYLIRHHLFFCGAGINTCGIDHEGNVLGCFNFTKEGYTEGNIKETPFHHIWRSRFQRYRNPVYDQECLDCPDFHGCRGGCKALRTMTGTCWKKTMQNNGSG